MVRAREKADSVYDFIYVDARRIGVLISQLGGGTDGVLVEQKRERRATSETSGEVSIHIAKADHHEGESSGIVRTFDPQWLRPLQFLDLANELINRKPASARLGEIILVKGTVELRDFRSVVAVLNSQNVRSRLANSINIEINKNVLSMVGVAEGQTPTNAQTSAARQVAVELVLEVIKGMPAKVQVNVKSEETSVWGVLREDGMIVSYDEVAITHGNSIPGEWAIVGLLDGHPDKEPDGNNNSAPIVDNSFSNSSSTFTALARKMVGRPFGTYAITPLMIFRELPQS